VASPDPSISNSGGSGRINGTAACTRDVMAITKTAFSVGANSLPRSHRIFKIARNGALHVILLCQHISDVAGTIDSSLLA